VDAVFDLVVLLIFRLFRFWSPETNTLAARGGVALARAGTGAAGVEAGFLVEMELGAEVLALE